MVLLPLSSTQSPSTGKGNNEICIILNQLRQKTHLDTLDKNALSEGPFTTTLSIIVGVVGTFSITCYNYDAYAVDERDVVYHTHGTNTRYELGPGDMLIFDADYTAHYGDKLESASVRLHVNYHRELEPPMKRPHLIRTNLSKTKYMSGQVYIV